MNNIRKAREQAGLSQKEVAITLGVSAPTVSEWESGKKNPSIVYVKQMVHVYGVSSDYLLGLVENEKKSSAAAEAAPEEIQLMKLYRNLNGEGREKLLDYAADLDASGRYIKTNSPGLEQRQA